MEMEQDQVRVAFVGKSFGRAGGIEVPTTQADGEVAQRF